MSNNIFGGKIDILKQERLVPIEMHNYNGQRDAITNSVRGSPRRRVEVLSTDEIKRLMLMKQNTNVDEVDKNMSHIKVIEIAPGFRYGVDTREYYPKKRAPVGCSVSDMAGY